MSDPKFSSLPLLLISFALLLAIAGCSSSSKVTNYEIPTSPHPSIDTLQVFSDKEVDQKPGPKGGYRNILSKVRYPAEARKVGATGKVVVKLVVTPKGEGISHYIQSSPHPVLSKEALRVIRSVDFEPGMKNGQFVHSWLAIPISFNLQTNSK